MSNSRVLIVDGQLFQSQAFHRGIGKYSLSLLGEISEFTKFYEKRVLLLNKSIVSQEDRKVIATNAKGFDIVELDYKLLSERDINSYKIAVSENRTIVDSFIAVNYQDSSIDFVILSLFQESECPVFPTNCNMKYVIAYDLIPLQFPKLYLHDKTVRDNYLCRFDALFEADHFFPISRTVATDLTMHLGIPSGSV